MRRFNALTHWPVPRQDFRLLPLGVASLVGAWLGLRWPSGLSMVGVQIALAMTVFLARLLSWRMAKQKKLFTSLAGADAPSSGGEGSGTQRDSRGASVRRHVVLVCTGVYMLYLLTSLNVHVAHPAALHAQAQEKTRVEMTGMVNSRVEARVSPWGTRSCQGNMTVPQRLSGALIQTDPLVRAVGLPCDVLEGQQVKIQGKLAPLEHVDRPAALVYASHVVVTGEPYAPARVVAMIKRDLTALIATRPDHVTGLLPGVALGDDGQISPDLSAAMKLTQLTHLIAVSGGHISLAATIVLATIGRRFPLACALTTLAALGSLIILVGPEASVIRAVAMSCVVLAALACGRGTQAVASLSIALFAVAVVHPWMAVSYGFLLSASATAGIVLVGTPLAEYLGRAIPSLLAEAVAIPLAAQMACLPVLALFTDTGSIWGVLANALVAPVVAPLTICGLAVALSCPIVPALAQCLLLPVQMCTWWIATVARTLAGWPGSGISLAWSGVFCLALGMILIIVKRPIILAVMLVALLLFGLRGLLPGTRTLIPTDWAVVQCDVGQGSALIARILRTNPGASDTATGASTESLTVMIDVGPEGDAAASCLRDAGVTHLDLLVLSHSHSDHIGGLPAVLQDVSVGAVWLSPNPDPRENTQWLHDQLAAYAIPYEEVVSGTFLTLDGTTVLGERTASHTQKNDDGAPPDPFATVLWPRVRDTTPGEANAQSIVLHLNIAGGLLVLSDLTADSQDKLARDPWVTDKLAQVHTVVVAHHGSADQSTALATLLDPDLALISVGHNSYGHPTERALGLYGEALIHDTLTCGVIAVDGKGIPSSGCSDEQ